ncbi:urease accessory protein UreF [Rhizobium sp. RU36D]|uniref:urease accessory protein UreF n=1 Tax=Rhizobium sp. RU36D TaxID=1907415 RepID=UPI0009D8FC89|nr:urease accessory protein UreF [Rhizobium sp. RU36D]SMC39589.1 urease accessory protein [Rhizobium sp. RU36D]
MTETDGRFLAKEVQQAGDLQSLLRLMTWLSPAFPVGGFAYSGGLERAVADGLVENADGLRQWIASTILNGTGWNDAVLMAEAMRCSTAQELAGLVELAVSLAGSAERHAEILGMGRAFLEAAQAWPHPVLSALPKETPYAVAVGAVAGAHGISPEKAIGAFLNALASQAVSAGIRLSVLGQRQGVALLSGLEHAIAATAQRASGSALDDLGSATILAEISAIRHETQPVRLFRS